MIYLLSILAGSMSGLLIGLIPGFGQSLMLVAAFPILMSLPAEACILFYIALIQCTQFSGSVAAINFGLLGEPTSEPALRERPLLFGHGIVDRTLDFTALGSVIGGLVAMSLMLILLEWFGQQTLLLRTETVCIVTVTVCLSAIMISGGNPRWINLIMLITGVFLSLVGFNNITMTTWFTGDLSVLYGGIPYVSVLAGLIAVPAIVSFKKITVEYSQSLAKKTMTMPWSAAVRGTGVGMFVGMIPLMGNVIVSNVAWWIEKKSGAGNDTANSSLRRVVAAETANNAANVMVLVPLLTLGLAIVPSEMILLAVLEPKNWSPFRDTVEIWGLHFHAWLAIGLIMASMLSYLVCKTFVGPVSKFCSHHINKVNIMALMVISCSVFYAGYLVEHRMLFITVFVLCSLLSIMFKRWTFMPMVVGFLVGEPMIENLHRAATLYQF